MIVMLALIFTNMILLVLILLVYAKSKHQELKIKELNNCLSSIKLKISYNTEHLLEVEKKLVYHVTDTYSHATPSGRRKSHILVEEEE